MLHLSRSCLLLANRSRLMGSSLHTTGVLKVDKVEKMAVDQRGKNRPTTDAGQSAHHIEPKLGEGFMDRNEKLKRPLSPHLTIYQMQLPMLLSGTHRVSGFMLGLGLGLTSLGILVAPHDFQHYVDAIHHMHLNEYLLFTIKMSAAWLLSYHYFNGIRHLLWDVGKGFQLPVLYRSGYAVLALSIASALYLATR